MNHKNFRLVKNREYCLKRECKKAEKAYYVKKFQ